MLKTAPLWNSSMRKEAFELLEKLWADGDDQIRSRISAAIVSGPPEHLFKATDAAENAESRDRRVFDRIGILARIDNVSLPAELSELSSAIQQRHPEWRLALGERAMFGTWIEWQWGNRSKYSEDDLRAISDSNHLANVLSSQQELREGLLEVWERFAGNNPDRALEVLEQLSGQNGGGPIDVWKATLWGLRGSIKQPHLKNRLIMLIAEAPEAVLNHIEFCRAVADLLEAALSDIDDKPPDSFWMLFDRLLPVAESDPENMEGVNNDQWVDKAINSSLGNLATAFFNALFSYRLKYGAGIPVEHLDRLNRLIGGGERTHRLARVIAASRLPYLFAVDSGWSRKMLLPSFDWVDEDEAIAVWQGFTWNPTIGPELWDELSRYFFDAFTPNRLRRLESSARTIAQLLMLAGIEYRHKSVSTERALSAIRAMTDEMRNEALFWIYDYLNYKSGAGEIPQGDRADILWTDRVQPWLKRAWPREGNFRTPALAERFSLLATSTSAAFPEAVVFIKPFLVKADASLLIDELNKSSHPDKHAESTLILLAAILDSNVSWLPTELRNILNRMSAAYPAMLEHPDFRRFDAALKKFIN